MDGPRAVRRVAATGGAIALAVVLAAGCDDRPAPKSSFYDERIAPTLQVGCVQQTAGCHIASERGTATGNLDLSSFDALMRREDVLPVYGPYPLGLLLHKGGSQGDVTVRSAGAPVEVTTDIRHNAGPGIEIGSDAFAKLKQWIERGATRNGVPPEELSRSGGTCSERVGYSELYEPGAVPTGSDAYDLFVSEVQPVMRDGCAGSHCHGNPIVDLYLTCGNSDEQSRWNFFVATQFLDDPAGSSELLDRPLRALRGGTYHEGGDVFDSPEDEDYQTMLEWAQLVVDEQPELLDFEPEDEGLRFFATRVQPALVRKGCMFLNCHSPAMFHDLRLRGGSKGFFSPVATVRNYHRSLLQLAQESPDPNQSRMVAKNLFTRSLVDGGEGIRHRGGSLFEDFAYTETGDRVVDRATADDCDDPEIQSKIDEGAIDDVPAYCVLVRWHRIERERFREANGLAEGEVVRSLVWVERPMGEGAGHVLDFSTFRGGSMLMSQAAEVADSSGDGVAETLSVTGSPANLLSDPGCPGLGETADVRRPAVSWDARKLVFAARDGADEPLRLYWMDLTDTGFTGCEPVPGIAPERDRRNGILLHDFDPAFAPDGRLVFASTRGNLDGPDYGGPTRTPASLEPNANLYIAEPGGGSPRQLTYLLNQELAPSLMADGRLIFTAQKRQPGFHQLALRRQNLDGADYHPLFAQRDSVGFESATEVIELPNRNLAFIAGPIREEGFADDAAGTLVVVNRSIGPDQDDRDSADRFYVHSMSQPVGAAAFERIPGVPAARQTSRGVYRSPSRLPTGRILVSCELDADDLHSGPDAFDLCELDPESGEVRAAIAGDASMASVEAVAIHARPVDEVYESRLDEPNGATGIEPGDGDAVVHMLDFPLLETLLFANRRTDHRIDPEVGGIRIWQAEPPPPDATGFGGLDDVVEDRFGPVYAKHTELGFVPLNADGSAKFRVQGGAPILYEATDGDGDPLPFPADDPRRPFEGDRRLQKEQLQYYPGERIRQSFPRRFFDGMCGGCHGSITGRELNVAIDVDVLTSASKTQALGKEPVDLR